MTLQLLHLLFSLQLPFAPAAELAQVLPVGTKSAWHTGAGIIGVLRQLHCGGARHILPVAGHLHSKWDWKYDYQEGHDCEVMKGSSFPF